MQMHNVIRLVDYTKVLCCFRVRVYLYINMLSCTNSIIIHVICLLDIKGYQIHLFLCTVQYKLGASMLCDLNSMYVSCGL
uniref:Uncharacterized protein n=1 Tax=Anguilla anguilla TaxID=7936 RepID=A0A0E9SL29_ANGAN